MALCCQASMQRLKLLVKFTVEKVQMREYTQFSLVQFIDTDEQIKADQSLLIKLEYYPSYKQLLTMNGNGLTVHVKLT